MNTSAKSELYTFIPFMVDDERAFIMQLSANETVTVASVIFISVVWGNIMEFFIYFQMAQEKLGDRPINILIFLDQVLLI